MTPERRESDREISDLRVIVADHIGRCAELNKLAIETLGDKGPPLVQKLGGR